MSSAQRIIDIFLFAMSRDKASSLAKKKTDPNYYKLKLKNCAQPHLMLPQIGIYLNEPTMLYNRNCDRATGQK